jgi:hypothetical protein
MFHFIQSFLSPVEEGNVPLSQEIESGGPAHFTPHNFITILYTMHRNLLFLQGKLTAFFAFNIIYNFNFIPISPRKEGRNLILSSLREHLSE